jgi:hypothetical protein
MITKTFEVRDRGTFIPMLAIKLEPADDRDRWLLGRAGFGTTPEAQREYVILYNLVQQKGTYDAYGWETGARTLPVAHQHIIDQFDALPNGAVVCVETILGERTTPKVSEQQEVLR